MVTPAIPPTVQEIPNPLRGQYESLLEPAFPPSQSRAATLSSVARIIVTPVCVSRGGSCSPPIRARYPPMLLTIAIDFSVIDDALTKLAAPQHAADPSRVAYNSCCDATYPNNTNIAIPDWMRPALPPAIPAPPNSPTPGVTQVVPNWNDPTYLNAFGQLLPRWAAAMTATSD